MKRRTIFVAVAALAACGVACSGSKGEVKQAPHIEVEPATLTPVIDEGAIPLNDTYSYQIRVYNTGNMPLHLSAVSMAYQKCPGEEDANQAFTMTSGTVPATIAPQGKGTPDTPESLMINVIYKRLAVTCERIAEVAIDNDDPDVNRRHLVLRFSVNKPVPHLEADEVVDFGFVASGQPAVEQFLTLNNTGQGPVTVTGINYIGQEGFSFVWKCKHKPGVASDVPLPVKPAAASLAADFCTEPVVIQPNSGFQVPVRYATADETVGAHAYLTFLSDDPRFKAGEGLKVELRANVGGSCLAANPAVWDFGSVVTGQLKAEVVQLTACGDKSVHVTGVHMKDGSSDDYELDTKNLGELSATKPLKLDPGEKRSFVIQYQPKEVHKDAQGKVMQDKGWIIVENDSPRKNYEIQLTGMGVSSDCPVAEFKIYAGGSEVKDKGEVATQTKVTFKDQSYDKSGVGQITEWQWTVQAPPGSADTYSPTASYQNPSMTLNVAGDYLFCLKIRNNLGIASCNDACKTVVVKAGEGCHIELLWNTPADPDQKDNCGANKDCGSDMDLHVVHPYASSADIDKDGQPDGFFDLTYDCFWFNPHPTWDQAHPNDTKYQPNLDRDDTDGAGPENFNYAISEPGKCYKVGIHYWDDHTWGVSIPTVRIYLDGLKIWEKTAPKMNKLDLWELGKVCCSEEDPAKVVEEFSLGGAPVIIKNYKQPDFFGP